LYQASRRSKIERISIWTRSKDEQVNLGIGKRLVEAMKLIEHQVEFEVGHTIACHDSSLTPSALDVLSASRGLDGAIGVVYQHPSHHHTAP
jgi:hypothetical protein